VPLRAVDSAFLTGLLLEPESLLPEAAIVPADHHPVPQEGRIIPSEHYPILQQRKFIPSEHYNILSERILIPSDDAAAPMETKIAVAE
jgi:hypothetical protein